MDSMYADLVDDIESLIKQKKILVAKFKQARAAFAVLVVTGVVPPAVVALSRGLHDTPAVLGLAVVPAVVALGYAVRLKSKQEKLEARIQDNLGIYCAG